MSNYMNNQGLVDGITSARNRQRDLEAEVERLTNLLEYALNEIKDSRKEIAALEGDLEVMRLQRDAKRFTGGR